MKKKYVVRLSKPERAGLERLVGSGRESARKLTRARVLLKADANAQGWSDTRIASALGVARVTAERIRKRFAEGGCAHAVERRPQPQRPAKRVLDGRAEAHLTTLACSKPPDGRESWTLELLADRMVRLRFVDSVSADTVGRVLKKRAQAVAEGAVVHPPGTIGGVRVPHGGRAGRVPPAVRPPSAAGVRG